MVYLSLTLIIAAIVYFIVRKDTWHTIIYLFLFFLYCINGLTVIGQKSVILFVLIDAILLLKQRLRR
jgi:hypothetical protein